MRPRRPTEKSDSPRPRDALHRIAALSVALLVVASGVFGVVGFGASAALQDAGNDATAVQLGQQYSDEVHENDTRDVYTFEAEQGEYLRVGTYNGAATGVGMTIVGPSGQEIETFELYPEWILTGAEAPETGEYRVVFEGGAAYSEESPVDYEFEVNVVAPDDYEPNGGMSSAATLQETTTVDAELGEGEEDWYAVEAAEGTAIVADLDRDANLLDNSYTVQLVDSSGTVLDEANSKCTPGAGPCNPGGVSVTAPSDGTYFVRVAPGEDGIRGYDAYTMWTSFQPPSEEQEQAEDGDPKPATLGSEQTDTVSTADSADAYTFSADQGDYIRVGALVGTPDVFEATLLGPSGQELDTENGEFVEEELLGTEAPETGEYRVEFRYSGDRPQEDPQSYQFSIDVATPDGYEQNDERASATELSGTATVDAVNEQYEKDWYAVEVAGGSTLEVDVDRATPAHNGNSYFVEIMNEDGDVVEGTSPQCYEGSPEPCDPPAISTTAPEDGTYYVIVGGGITGFSEYTLSVNADTPAEDTETPEETETPDETTESPDDSASPDQTETPDDTETPDETETPDDTTESPASGDGSETNGDQSDDADSEDGDTDGADDGTDSSDDSDSPDSTGDTEDSDSTDDADTDDDSSSGDSSNTDDSTESTDGGSDSSDTEESGTDDSADDSSSDSDSSDDDSTDDSSDSTDDTSDDSSQSADGGDDETDVSTGGDDSGSSGDSDSSADDSAGDSDSEDGSDDSDTTDDENSDTDQSTTESSESDGDGTPTDDGETAVTTTDGEEAAAGPSAPVNNSSDEAGVVQGGEETDSSSGFGPGFGVVVALIAMLAVALLARRAQ